MMESRLVLEGRQGCPWAGCLGPVTSPQMFSCGDGAGVPSGSSEPAPPVQVTVGGAGTGLL